MQFRRGIFIPDGVVERGKQRDRDRHRYSSATKLCNVRINTKNDSFTNVVNNET